MVSQVPLWADRVFLSLELNTSTLPPGGGEKRCFYKQIKRAWQPAVLGVTQLIRHDSAHTQEKKKKRGVGGTFGLIA